MLRPHVIAGHRDGGFSLIEFAIILLMIGIFVQVVIQGQALIQSARVGDMIAQQQAAEAAVLAFEDRFRAPPGDYGLANVNIVCTPGSCINGDGNGRVETPNGAGLYEDLLAWNHLSAAGFLEGSFALDSITQSAPSNGSTPRNAFGGFLQVVHDSDWGYSGNTTKRANIKTGNQVPTNILAEVDRRIDDGLPGAGRFQFSWYAGDGDTPVAGMGGCTSADSVTAEWMGGTDYDNCGAATLLR